MWDERQRGKGIREDQACPPSRWRGYRIDRCGRWSRQGETNRSLWRLPDVTDDLKDGGGEGSETASSRGEECRNNLDRVEGGLTLRRPPLGVGNGKSASHTASHYDLRKKVS